MAKILHLLTNASTESFQIHVLDQNILIDQFKCCPSCKKIRTAKSNDNLFPVSVLLLPSCMWFMVRELVQ